MITIDRWFYCADCKKTWNQTYTKKDPQTCLFCDSQRMHYGYTEFQFNMHVRLWKFIANILNRREKK